MKHFSTHILISPPGLPGLRRISSRSGRRRIGVGHGRCVTCLWWVAVVRMELAGRGRRDTRVLLAGWRRIIRSLLSLVCITSRWWTIWLILLLGIRILAIRRPFSCFLTCNMVSRSIIGAVNFKLTSAFFLLFSLTLLSLFVFRSSQTCRSSSSCSKGCGG